MVSVTGTEKMLFSVREAALATGVSRSSLYNLMESGELAWTMFGSKRLIDGESLRAFVQQLLQDGAVAK